MKLFYSFFLLFLFNFVHSHESLSRSSKTQFLSNRSIHQECQDCLEIGATSNTHVQDESSLKEKSVIGRKEEDKRSHFVLVSVSPHRFFVDQIASDTVRIGLLVPAGASSHTFEPSPKLMTEASKADAWFLLGETFEDRAIPVLKNYSPNMSFIDLRNGVDLIVDDHHMCCCCRGADPHIWLSPRLAKIQAETIANALSELYPENKEVYSENLKKFTQKLDSTDHELERIFSEMDPRIVLVAHPAYGYLARDYRFKQISIEFEGKDPTPRQLTETLKLARKEKIKTVFVQPQYSNKGAKLVAKEIGAKVVTLDPYSEEYFISLNKIARAFANKREIS